MCSALLRVAGFEAFRSPLEILIPAFEFGGGSALGWRHGAGLTAAGLVLLQGTGACSGVASGPTEIDDHAEPDRVRADLDLAVDELA